MEEPDSFESETKDVPRYATLVRSTSRRSTPGRSTSGKSPSGRSTPGRSISSRSTPGRSTSGRSPSGRSISGKSISGRSTSERSTPDRSTTPEVPPVPPATYHWEEVRRKRSVGGYPWTHLDKPPFDEKTWVKYERDHVYEPVAPAASKERTSPPVKPTTGPPRDEARHFLRIPLTEELVMADDTGSEPEVVSRRPTDADIDEDDEDGVCDDEEDEEEEDDEDDDGGDVEKKSDGSIYEGENENSDAGVNEADPSNTRMKAFQQKVKVKADILRAKLQGVTKRKPKQKIVVDAPNGEKNRRKFGQFATLPKKFTFNAAKVNFSTAFSGFTKSSADAAAPTDESGDAKDDAKSGAGDDAKSSGRFSLPRFGFTRTSSESPRPSKSMKIGGSRISIPGFRQRTWSDASKTSKPESPKPRIMDFGTYPRIFSKRRKTNAENKANTPPPSSTNGDAEPSNNNKRKDSFRRRFFRSHKESTPGPTGEQHTATLAVEEELDEVQASKESLAEFGDSDLQEVISLGDGSGRSNKDTKSLCSEHRPGVIEEIDSDEFFLREKGLSRGDVHISNYLSSEIRDVFRRSNRTRSVEVVNGGNSNSNSNRNSNSHESNDGGGGGGGVATPVRPSRTNSLRRPAQRAQNYGQDSAVADRFSTMPKSFGGSSRLLLQSAPTKPDAMPENIITSQTFEPSSASPQNTGVPSTFRVPWRTGGARKEEETAAAAVVTHMPPKPPGRHQRMTKFSTFDTRSMIDLSRKRSQSQIGFLPSMNFSETVPKAPLRRSRTSLAGSERDVSVTSDSRPSWVPTPPLRRSRMSLAAADLDAEDRSAAIPPTPPSAKSSVTPPRPPPPQVPAGYATVDKTQSQLVPPQSPMRHRRKKSYEVIKSQEFGAFFTIPRSYSYGRKASVDQASSRDHNGTAAAETLQPPSRPARQYNTLGPSRPHRRRLPVREHEYGDVADDDDDADDDGDRGKRRQVHHHKSSSSVVARSVSLDEGDGPAKVLCSGDVIEKMKLRPLPSPPPPPRKAKTSGPETPEPHRRRNTDSALVPFLDPRETSAASSDDFFADVSRALMASAAKASAAAAATTAAAAAADDVSIGVQTDPLPDGYELDDLESSCSAESDRPASRASSTAADVTAAAADQPTSRTSTTAATLLTAERPTSRTSTTTEYVDRPTSRMSTNAGENGYIVMPDKAASGVICAQRISVNELQVGKMIVADIRGQRMGVDDVSGSSLKIGHLVAGAMAPSLEAAAATATAAVLPPPCNDDLHHQQQHHHQQQDDAVSVQSSRVSSMYPEVDSDEDRASVLAAPTPPRRRSRPPTAHLSSNSRCSAVGVAGDLQSSNAAAAAEAAVDPSITELSCQLFRLCHSNVCSLFNKVVQQVVPEDTEKRRDLQAALCFLSIILAGLLILGFGNEKTIHHHHWDFQFPPPNQ